MKHGNIEIKKRLMFAKGDDFYFLTYNSLILLYSLECDSDKNLFIDSSKIAFLTDFIADSNCIRLLELSLKEHAHLGSDDIQTLQHIYVNSLSRRHLLSRLLFVLQKRGFVSIETNKNDNALLDIYLNLDKMPKQFFNPAVYQAEIENAKKLRKLLPRIKTIALKTLLNRLFTQNGVNTWHV
jgi:hypothetical protein